LTIDQNSQQSIIHGNGSQRHIRRKRLIIVKSVGSQLALQGIGQGE